MSWECVTQQLQQRCVFFLKYCTSNVLHLVVGQNCVRMNYKDN